MRGADNKGPPTFVLVPGYLGFDRIGLGRFSLRYFRHLPAAIERLGMRCLVADNLPASESVAVRAKALQVFLAKHDVKRVILIAHSMGGLDSRYFISRLDHEQRVCGLVTLGTPHRGTPLATRTLKGRGAVPYLLRAIGTKALQALTPEACTKFNKVVLDRSDVPYLWVAGERPADERIGLLRLTFPKEMDKEGPNDGLVSVESASWGNLFRIVQADHFELVGWSLAFSELPVLRWFARKQRPPFNHLKLHQELIEYILSSPDFRFTRASQGGDSS